MQDTILSIAGRPGLYRLVAQGRGNLIVEAVDATKKRFVAGARDRVTSLNDVSMYTTEEDKPLMDIFESIRQYTDGKVTALSHKTASNDELAAFMQAVLPNYDADRVHFSDIRKLIQWYNILIEGGYTDFSTEEATEEETVAE